MNYSHIWAKVLRHDEQVMYEFSISTLYIIWMMVVNVVGALLCSVFLSSVLQSSSELMGNISLYYYFDVALLSLASLWIAGTLLYYGFYIRIANAYALTSSRVIVHRGWLSTSAVSVAYNDITDVSVHENFIEKILSHSGSIAINTAGTDSEEINLFHISNPYDVRKKVDELRDELKT